MVAELDVLNEWIPEHMVPGAMFVLENAGEVGEADDPYWAVLAFPYSGNLTRNTLPQDAVVRHARLDHASPGRGLDSRDLRLRRLLRPILPARAPGRRPQTLLVTRASRRSHDNRFCAQRAID